MPQIQSQFPATVSLSALNGQTGVKFTCENSEDCIYSSVNDAGDINGDGIADLIIGTIWANSTFSTFGVSYLVFGHNGGLVTPINLCALTGANGIKFVGESLNDESGLSVSGAGDVNGDGVANLIIGAPSANSYTGMSYLVFGHTGNWTSPTNLSTLAGTNGVKFVGENSNDFSGYSVSSAGDINEDGIVDIIIGAWGANGNSGASYLVFGHKGNWTSPINLSTLTGENGVKFAGENYSDMSGVSVSGGGDVNGDGIEDLIIGASRTNDGAGASYLVFGHKENWTSPISLSALTGTNGVKFVGENINDENGYSVSMAGDVNKDGITDILIGSGDASVCYVIFGQTGSWLSPMSLSDLTGKNGVKFIQLGGIISLVGRASDVNGDGTADLIIGATGSNGYVVFGHTGNWTNPMALSTLTGIDGVRFIGENYEVNGFSVSGTGDVNGDGIADLIIGANVPSNYASTSYLVFGDNLGQLNQALFTLQEGESLLFNSSYLKATYGNKAPTKIQFNITNQQNGHFEFLALPGQTINQFTQQQINGNQIRFVDHASCSAPSYQVSTNDGGIAFTPPNKQPD